MPRTQHPAPGTEGNRINAKRMRRSSNRRHAAERQTEM
jgi:hypothetical protein